MNDSRILWIRDRVLTFMSENVSVFDDMLERDNEVKYNLSEFLDSEILYVSDSRFRTMVFCKSYIDAIIEEEVLVPEVVVKKSHSRPDTRSTQSEGNRKEEDEVDDDDDDDDDEDYDKTDKGTGDKGKSKGKSKGKGKVKSGKRGKVKTEENEGVEEPNSRGSPEDATSPVTEGEREDVEEEEESKKKKKRKKSKGDGKRKKSGRISPETLVETVAEPEPETNLEPEQQPDQETQSDPEPEVIMVMKKVEKVIKKPVLHLYFGDIPSKNDEDSSANRFIYFSRYYEYAVPHVTCLKEAWEILPSCMNVGTIETDSLRSFNQIFSDLFMPLVASLFFEPCRIDSKYKKQVRETDPFRKTCKKPSYYLNLALDLKKEAKKQSSMPSASDLQTTTSQIQDPYHSVGTIELLNETLLPSETPKQPLLEVIVSSETSSENLNFEKEVQTGHVSLQTNTQDENPDKLYLLEKMNGIFEMVQWIIEQKESSAVSVLPYVEIFHSDSDFTFKDQSFIEKLEQDVSTLQSGMMDILHSLLSKNVASQEPLEEYFFWEDRYKTLDAVVKELKLIQPNIDKVTHLLEEAESTLIATFHEDRSFLMKIYYESLNNHTFLSSIKRYLEVITEFHSFVKVKDAIETLMKKLYLIWIMSSYYNTDNTMVSLMERIAHILLQNILKYLKVDNLLKMPLKEMQCLLVDCRDVLRTWKKSYNDVRQMIEDKGRSHRWEFDRKKLFYHSDWVITVCNDLLSISKVLQDFNNFFGEELKSILEDPAQVDAVMDHVYSLLNPIKNSEFDIFDCDYQSNWESLMKLFKEDLQTLESQADYFITSSLRLLRDSGVAIKTLIKFTQIETRPVIQEELEEKLQYVIQHYKKELIDIENYFQKNKMEPPLNRNHSYFAGAIHWSRELYSALRKPILIFQTVPEFRESKLKKTVTYDFLEVANEMKKYMENKFSLWLEKAVPSVKTSLKRNILKCVIYQEMPTLESLNNQQKYSKMWGSPALQRLLKTSHSLQKMKKSNTSCSSSESFVPVWRRPPTPVNVSMSHHTQSSKQAKSLLTGMGMRVALYATRFKRKRSSKLTESAIFDSEYAAHLQDMKQMTLDIGSDLNDYEMYSWDENTAEIKQFHNFLFTWIRERKGRQHETWPSIMGNSILLEYNLRFDVNFNDELLNTLEEAIFMENLGHSLPAYLKDIVMQKDNIALEHEKISKIVLSYNNLLKSLTKAEISFLKNHLMKMELIFQRGLIRINWASLDIHNFISECQKELISLTYILKQLHKISYELQGRVRLLPSYNLFWIMSPGQGYFRISAKGFFTQLAKYRDEEFAKILAVYKSITPVLIKLEGLVLQTCTGAASNMMSYYAVWEVEAYNALLRLCIINIKSFIQFLHSKEAYFRVDTALNPPDVVLQPSPLELYNIMIHCISDFLKRFRFFKRWLSTTCIECPPLKNSGTGEEYNFTFFDEIVKIPQVRELIAETQKRLQHVVTKVSKTITRWKCYQNLWMHDQISVTEKFASGNPPLKEYDEMFFYYENVIQESKKLDTYIDVNCIRINFIPVIEAVVERALQWKNQYGSCLARTAREKMSDFIKYILELRTALEMPTDNLQDFKFVLQTISNIHHDSLETEFRFQLIRDSFHTLQIHDIPFPQEELELADDLARQWENLCKAAITRERRLESSKLTFALMTQDQIKDFKIVCNQFAERFTTEGPPSVGDDLDLGLILMEEYTSIFKEINEKRLDLVSAEILFDLPMTDYSDFLSVFTEMEGLEKLYSLYRSLNEALGIWGKTLWVNLDSQLLIEELDQFFHMFQLFPLDVQKLSTGIALEKHIKKLKYTIPLMVELKSKSLRKRHWEELMHKSGYEFDTTVYNFTLNHMFAMKLHNHVDAVTELITRAVKELAIELGLNEIEETWSKIEFTVCHYLVGDKDKCLILGPLENILQLLESDSIKLQNMAESQYVGPFLDTIQSLEKSLRLISDVLDKWICVQRKWLTLKALFMKIDVHQNLPQEVEIFTKVDQAFKKIMKETSTRKNIQHCCHFPGRLSELKEICVNLCFLEKSLKNFLDAKRNLFPRFYFVSNEELVCILGSQYALCVHEYMNKMFDNISRFKCISCEKEQLITAIISVEEEIMFFHKECLVGKFVEKWMSSVLTEIFISHQSIIKKAIYDYGKGTGTRMKWFLDFQSSVCLTAGQVWWTAEVENVFEQLKQGRKTAMKEYLQTLNKQINDLVNHLQMQIKQGERKKFDTILTIDVHSRDVIESFIRDSIVDPQDFQWERQLRFYWMRDVDELFIKQCVGMFKYGYEYSGLNSRLVITPLTDRVHLTLTQALSLHFGGSVIGPVGTGKSETVKDLAKAMGFLCKIFNCSYTMSRQIIGRILTGLVQSGVWGCFNDFNLMSVQELSIISSYLQAIRNALIFKADQFMMGDFDLFLDRKIGIFITNNPENPGHTEFPESMKVHFRPVVCTVPDIEYICGVKLFCKGYRNAKILAKKMATLLKIAKDILSQQCHYNFKLESIKTMLNIAGTLKCHFPKKEEEELILNTIIDVYVPQLVSEDVPLFLQLAEDLFPKSSKQKRVGENDIQIKENIIQILNDKQFTVLPVQIEKVMQLFEILQTKHCAMVVGSSGSGKSVIIEILTKLQSSKGLAINLTNINPKAYTIHQLYGLYDSETSTWTDGLLSHLFHNLRKSNKTKMFNYIVFDGDVDSLWTENLNSALDSNMFLTLPDSNCISLEQNCVLLFEVGNLEHASPATVSRAGIVFANCQDLGYLPFWNHWVQQRDYDEQDKFQCFFQKYIPETIEYVFTLKEDMKIFPQTALNMITQLCFMLDAILPVREEEEEIPTCRKFSEIWFEEKLGVVGEKRLSKCSVSKDSCKDTSLITQEMEDTNGTQLCDPLETVFLYAIYWSIGALLCPEGCSLLDNFLKRKVSFLLTKDSLDKKAKMTQIPETMPSLYNYFLNLKEGIWEAWDWLVPKYIYDPKIKFNDIVVPTSDTLKLTWLLNLVIEHNFRRRRGQLMMKIPVLVIGESGIAKSSIINYFLNSLSTNNYVLLNIHFSSFFTTLDMQQQLNSILEKRMKDMFGPPRGKQLLCFIDDLNRPKVDKYGTQQPLAMLKLLFERGGYYDPTEEFSWKNVKDSAFLAAMNIGNIGQKPLDPRFVSKFAVFNLTAPSEKTVKYIFTAILEGYMMSQSFKAEVVNIASILVDSTYKLYEVVKSKLLLFPSKYHYVFSLMNFSQVVTGLCASSSKHFVKPEDFARLWHNEFQRTFMDRLVCNEDLFLMRQELAETIEKVFPQWSSVILREPLLYGDFHNFLSTPDIRIYEDLLDYDAVFALLQEILSNYNLKNAKIDLVLFDEVLEHFTRVHRIIRLQNGHAMLAGIDGIGKQSITRLVAFTAGHDVFTLQQSSNYNEISFKEDLLKLFHLLGVENKSTVFLVSGAQLVEKGFMEWINHIIKFGIVSTLFPENLKNNIIDALQKAAQDSGYGSSRKDTWQYFCNACRNNLHVVICMTPVGNYFHNCCQNFPSLIRNTVIDWIFTWSNEALTAIASFYLSENPKIQVAYRSNAIKHVVHIHNSVERYAEEMWQCLHRKYCVVPKHFLNYIQTYLNIFEEKSESLTKQCQLLIAAMDKVTDAQTQMMELQKTIVTQKETIEKKTRLCERLLGKIDTATEKVTKLSRLAENKYSELNEKESAINAEKEEIECILSEALPSLESANLSLSELERSDIIEVRSFATPPEPLQIVCECVAIFRGIKDVTWKAAKGIMADPNFLKSLQEMNYDVITTHQMRAVKAHLKKTQKLDQMKLISKAGFGLLKFVEAVLGYCQVYREAKPKKDHVQVMERERERMENDHKELTKEIGEAKLELKKVVVKYEAAVYDRKKLQEELEVMLQRLSIADKLVSGLECEKDRWSIELQKRKDQKKCLVGDCLLAAAFLSYAGPFTHDFRQQKLFPDWIHNLKQYSIPLTHPCKVEGSLLEDGDTDRWHCDGFPQDEMTIQNRILIHHSNRFPLCIDPQEQMVSWIKQEQRGKNLKILSFSDQNFLEQIEKAICIGCPVLLEDIEDYVDPVIHNLLQKNIREVDGKSVISFAGREMDYNSHFQLYLVSKLSNPNFDQTVYAKANVINFTMTTLGLEEHLLMIVNKYEQPDLEIKRHSLINEIAFYKCTQKDLENHLLMEVVNTDTYMLDNTDFLTTMEETKLKVDDIQHKLEEANQAIEEVTFLCHDYYLVAKHGSTLFSIITDMVDVNTFYKYSLQSYLDILELSLQEAIKDDINKNRVNNIISTLTEIVYKKISLGIHEIHKILFSFQITLKIELNKEEISQEQVNFFIRGNIKLSDHDQSPALWILPKMWNDVLGLESLFPSLSNLSSDIKENLTEWKKWFDHTTPELTKYPMNYRKRLKPFECLVLVYCFRKDRMLPAITEYISKVMGALYITPPVANFSEIKTNPKTPVLLVLHPGTEPVDKLMKEARFCGAGSRFRFLALGKGQEETASYMLKIAMKRGQWLLLQNCHLSLDFAKTLIGKIQEFEKPHSEFRLWLTTNPVPYLPTTLLQSSLKVVVEPPCGIRRNLYKTFRNLRIDNLDCSQHASFKAMIYALVFFNTVIQERCKYNKFGWNLSYDFHEDDLDLGIIMLTSYIKMHEKMYPNLPWIGIKCIISEIVYGGRFIDESDQDIVLQYVNNYMGNFLFEPTFYFFKKDKNKYLLPTVHTHSQYVDSVDQFPLKTIPEVLGMHESTEIIYNRKIHKELEFYLNELNPQTGHRNLKSNFESLNDFIIVDILDKVPDNFDIDNLKQNPDIQQSSISAVLIQELKMFNILITYIRKTLNSLQLALAGKIVINEELEEIAQSLVHGHLPILWQNLMPPTCLLLGKWINHLTNRVKQYTYWIETGDPDFIWLSGLQSPQSYIAAVKQTACHQNHWPLEEATLLISITSSYEREDVVLDEDHYVHYLEGLYLEGAHWDVSKRCLTHSHPINITEDLPILSIKTIRLHEMKLTRSLRVPVYGTPKRRVDIDTRCVLEVDFPINDHISNWVLQNICVLLNKD